MCVTNREHLAAFHFEKYDALGILARTSEAVMTDDDEDGEESTGATIQYEFLDYYPEENSQEFQTCEWAVVGYTKEEQNEDEGMGFEVICLSWEQETADALLDMLKDLSGLPISGPNSQSNR